MSGLFSGNGAVQEQSRMLFRHILACQPVTRPMVLSQLNLPPTSLNRALDRLMAAGLIETAGQADSTGGRPASRFQVRRDARSLLGISLPDRPDGAIRLMLLDLSLEPVARDELNPIDLDCSAGPPVEAIAAAAASLVGDGGSLLGIGIGGIEIRSGADGNGADGIERVAAGEAGPDWSALPARLAERFACSVALDDGLAGAGYLMARKAAPNGGAAALLCLDVPFTLVSDRQSRQSIAAFPVVDALCDREPALRPLQALLAVDAIGKRFAALRDEDVGFAEFCQACRLDKKKARRLLDATAHALAQAVMGIACISGLSGVAVCGAITDAIPQLVPSAAEKVARLGESFGIAVRLSQQPYGDDLRAAGAAAMVLARAIETPIAEQTTD